ncbi:hypothetical protein D3C87_1885830 [compost metagenome]
MHQLFGGHIRCVFYDLERLAVHIQNRVVGRLQPDFAPVLADASVFPGAMMALRQLFPERLIFLGFRILAINEHAVVHAAYV